jgi:Zn-dependent protease/predicted transcriptional regulator
MSGNAGAAGTRSLSREAPKWSWTVAWIGGIRISVHVTFLALVAWFAVAVWMEVGNLARVTAGVAFLLLVFGCVLAHELGHALMAQRFGLQTREITLLPIGGVARLERFPDNPMESLWIALAGPAVNIAIAGALLLVLRAAGVWEPLSLVGLTRGPFLERLMLVNISLAVFNMLPAFPMDGGRALRALLATRLDERRATRIAARLGQGMAVLFAVIGWLANPLMILIALFVWTGAAQEATMADLRSALHGIPVSQAMFTTFRSLAPDAALSTAVDIVQHEGQHDFPVIRGGRLVGLLTRDGLMRGLKQAGAPSPIADVMECVFPVVGPDDRLDAALAQLDAGQSSAAVVVHDGRLIGLLTTEAVAEFLALQAALGEAA